MKRKLFVYIAILLLAALAFVFTNNAVSLALLVTLVLVPLSEHLSTRAEAASVQVELHMQRHCYVGQNLPLEICIKRASVLQRGRIHLRFSCQNLLLGESWEVPVDLAPGSGAEERFTLPLDTARCGTVDLSLLDGQVQGAFGMGHTGLPKQSLAANLSYTVYPLLLNLTTTMERAPQATFTGSSYDPHRRGQDKSETFDVRDYHPGDTMNTVHWKLSQKFDDLLVRDPSHPANYDVLLLMNMRRYQENRQFVGEDDTRFGSYIQEVNAAFTLASSISASLSRLGMGHNVAFASGLGYEDVMVDSPASFDEMLDALMSQPLPEGGAMNLDAFDSYRRTRSFTKTILITNIINQDELFTLGRLTDLTAVFVNSKVGDAMEENAVYAQLSLSPEAVFTRLKNVSL